MHIDRDRAWAEGWFLASSRHCSKIKMFKKKTGKNRFNFALTTGFESRLDKMSFINTLVP